jgi:hypothetical protein
VPEEASQEAGRRASRRVEAGEYAEAAHFESLAATRSGGMERLYEWALIDVEPTVARSTRRGGAPITAFKRFLLRLLVQYHNEQAAQISRFNVHLTGELDVRFSRLEDRIREFERRLDRLERTVRR